MTEEIHFLQSNLYNYAVAEYVFGSEENKGV